MQSIWRVTFVAALVSIEPAFAQKIVDPNAVAPEYRAAAEKRRAEQNPIPRPIPSPALDSAGPLQPKQVRQVY